jgi:RHS repeat-associated protein
MLRSGTTSFYNADGLGSITSLTNSSGTISATYTFDSFGNQTGSTGSLTNSFRYTGRELDSETGLYFYRARHFDPSLGRFLNEDSNKEAVGGMNFYIYVRNDPTRYVDPGGMSPWDWWDKLWERLGFTRNIWNKGNKEIDWALCGVYYTSCLETGMGIKEDLAQALSSARSALAPQAA